MEKLMALDGTEVDFDEQAYCLDKITPIGEYPAHYSEYKLSDVRLENEYRNELVPNQKNRDLCDTAKVYTVRATCTFRYRSSNGRRSSVHVERGQVVATHRIVVEMGSHYSAGTIWGE